MLSTSFVTRLKKIAVRVAVEVPKRQPCELLFDLAPQPVHGALCDARHDVGLRPREDRREDVHEDRDSEDPGEGHEVNALARHRIGGSEHVRELTLALRAQ
jgi:hypothetical protein